MTVNLWSDTQTRPDAGMRRAMAEAEVGDEQRFADPTTTRLQERVAELLGHEAALFLPSGTMCNQIAIRLLTNNPRKIVGLEGYGLTVTDQVPIEHAPGEHNREYLRAKKERLGHMLHHQGLALDEEMIHEERVQDRRRAEAEGVDPYGQGPAPRRRG